MGTRYLTIAEMGQTARLSGQAIRDAVHRGEMEAIGEAKFIVAEEDFLRWLDSRRVTGKRQHRVRRTQTA